jgi:hypothetical protein
MARAILKNDKIVRLTVDPDLGVEIGLLPKGVGWERLRWNGSELIDLADLTTFFVHRGTFSLHATEQTNTEEVQMVYTDRLNLIKDPDTKLIRVKTTEELNQWYLDDYQRRRANEYPSLTEQVAAIMEYFESLPQNTPALQELLETIEEVKIKYPKPK